MSDQISSAYLNMLKKRDSWAQLGNVPIASIFHGSCSSLTESNELDSWIRKTDHGYPVPSSKIISPGMDFFQMRQLHHDWMETQHDRHMQQSHVSNITDDDLLHINKLIHGGMDYGHDSGSSDLTKFLLDSHGKSFPPTEFKRTSVDGSRSESMDLAKIDSILKKNTFVGQFHSFHGIGFDPSEKLGDGNLLHLPAYTSGSVNRNIALKYANFSPVGNVRHMIHMIHPHGQHGLYIGNGTFSDNEVLLPRNMTLKMFPNQPTEYHVGDAGVKVWVAHRLHHMEA